MRRYVLLLIVSILVVILSQTSAMSVARAASSVNHFGGSTYSIEHGFGCEEDDG
jgi:hypothetical protein